MPDLVHEAVRDLVRAREAGSSETMPRHPQHLTNSVSARQRVPSAPLFPVLRCGSAPALAQAAMFSSGRGGMFVPRMRLRVPLRARQA